MIGIVLITLKEAKEIYENLVLDSTSGDIAEDVYGFVSEDFEYNLSYNMFYPVKVDGSNEFLSENSLRDKEE
jgi:hypothetical protein